MKKLSIVTIALAAIFLFSGASMADDWKDESGKGPRGKSEYNHRRQGDKDRHDDHGGRDYKDRDDRREHRRDYDKHHGYRDRPYDSDRHYERYEYRGRRYDYHGHWSSWDHWDRYAKHHPDFQRHGHYYRENGRLMFRFVDPVTENSIFFSIGR